MAWVEERRGAHRFPIVASVTFREHGEREWRAASTLNISRSGVLFRTDGALPSPRQSVEFVVTLRPRSMTAGSKVRCSGRVVRATPEIIAGGGRRVAVTIDDYALEGLASN